MKSKLKNFVFLALTISVISSGCGKAPTNTTIQNQITDPTQISSANSGSIETYTPENYDVNGYDNSYYENDESDITPTQAEEILKSESTKDDDFPTLSDTNIKYNNNPITTLNIPKTEDKLSVMKFSLQMFETPSPIKKFFEPSALCFDENGDLFTVADKGYFSIFQLNKNGNSTKVSTAVKMNLIQLFKTRFKKKNKYDFEGLDFHNGVFYAADERDRKVFTIDKKGNIKDLNIDVNNYLKDHNIKNNASNSGLEGLAIDKTKNLMYLIKERQEQAILVVDLNTNKIIKHYKVSLPGYVEPTLTDASFFDGNLYVLVRSHRLILKLNPETGEVLTAYDYRRYEEDANYVYVKIPTLGGNNDPDGYGVMEGLAVTKDSFYVSTDNNMLPLKRNLLNNNPQLFRFKRPDI